MIVMKFGGSSAVSATAIEWMAGIVKSRLEDQPVLVVSAMGKTTDRLVEMMQHAALGSAYSAWCLFEELCRLHSQEVKRLLGAGATGVLGKRIAPKFRELHGLLIDQEEGRILTPDLKDQILSLGERLSSEIVAAAFERKGMYVIHIHACDGVVTTMHSPKQLRAIWNLCEAATHCSVAARDTVVVMGGFIGQNTRRPGHRSGAAARISPLLWWAPGSPRMRFKFGPT